MSNNKNTEISINTVQSDILSTEKQSDLIKSLSENYETGRDTANQILGKLQMAKSFQKVADIVSLSELIKIKENKLYRSLKGVSIELADGSKIDDIGSWENFCKAIGSSKSKVDEDIRNAHAIGLECFETLKKTGLTTQNFRDLRALSFDQREEFVDGINFDDKEAVTEHIDELKFQNAIQLSEANKQVKEAEQVVKAARELSSEKQQELNAMKEQESIRQFSQAPWHRDSLDSVNAMIEARGAISQGANQLLAVLNNLSENHELDDKAIDHIGRSLLSEAQHNLSVISDFCNDAFSILGDRYHPDLTADELFNQLHANEETISAE